MKFKFNNLPEGLQIGLFISLMLFIVANLIAFFIGIHDGGRKGDIYSNNYQDCVNYPNSRIGYIVSGYGVGCWMGKPLKKDKK